MRSGEHSSERCHNWGIIALSLGFLVMQFVGSIFHLCWQVNTLSKLIMSNSCANGKLTGLNSSTLVLSFHVITSCKENEIEKAFSLNSRHQKFFMPKAESGLSKQMTSLILSL